VLIDQHELAIALAGKVRQVELAEVAQLGKIAVRRDRARAIGQPGSGA